MRINIFILLLFTTPLLAQLPVLKHYTVQDGLPSSNIYNALEDSEGYMWFCTDRGITRFDGYNFELFDMENINAASDIWGLEEDKEGRIWLATFNSLVYFQDDKFYSFPLPKGFPYHMIQGYFFGSDGSHYINFVNAQGIHEVINLNPLELRYIAFPTIQEKHKLFFLKKDKKGRSWFSRQSNEILEIFFEEHQQIHLYQKVKKTQAGFYFHTPVSMPDSNFVFLSKEHLYHFDFNTLQQSPLSDVLKEDITLLPAYSIDGKNLFLTTNKGVKVFNKQWKQQLGYDFLAPFQISSIIEDKHDNVWIYTQNDGVYQLPARAKHSQHFTYADQSIGNNIIAMTNDPNGNIWIGTNTGEVKMLQKDGQFRDLSIQIKLANQSQHIHNNYPITGISFDEKGNLFVGYQNNFLIYLPAEKLTQSVVEVTRSTKFIHGSKDESIANQDPLYIYNLGAIKTVEYHANQGVLVATSSGIRVITINEDLLNIKKISLQRAYAAAYYQEQLWGGTKKGIYIYDNNHYGTPVSLFPDPINDLIVSTDDKIWIATDGNGLFRYDGTNIDTIPEMAGKNEIIKSLFLDDKNILWIATNKGITRLETKNNAPFTYQIQKITQAHGLATGEINQVYVRDGNIVAAGTKGLTFIKEKNLQLKKTPTTLQFTQFEINNETHPIQDIFELPHDSNQVSISYLSLSYESLKNIDYQYFMEGIDKEWQTTKEIKKEYTALLPGTYTFRLRAKDISGEWTPEINTQFIIHSPWWLTYPAFFTYLLIFGCLVYGLYCYQLQRILNQRELQRTQEMMNFKNRFYTNITHEFRTPLTIILGFTKQIKNGLVNDENKTLGLIQHHGNRLLTLVNQLLDLNRLEANAMPLHWVHQDIITYIAYLTGLFESTATAKNIQLVFYKEVDTLEMDYDAEKIQTIIYNLISNAIKFTPSGGKIIVHLSQDTVKEQFKLKISDTGKGINPETLSFIFNRFYQEKNTNHKTKGSGIGLALAKELVEHLGGIIEVNSSPQGTQFTILLPILHLTSKEKKQTQPEQLIHNIEGLFPIKNQVKLIKNANSNLPVILLVEDNADLRGYLSILLHNSYQVIIAEDGEVGINKAFEHIPDLIISDVMMPKTDGITLCDTLKKDERTSHIPIILLTGKASIEAKLEGLKYGADAYLTKPFEEEELLIRLEKLNELRQKLKNRYANYSLTKPQLESNIEIPEASPVEDVFLQKVRSIIEEHIDNPALNVQHLCQLVAMSRSQLHKKITALTGESTTRFIRNIRLSHARELLLTTELSISEIAYQTGFEAQYFTTVFTKTFGLSPTAFRQKNKV